MTESIQTFIPFAEVTLNDVDGVAADRIVNTQGLPLKLVMGLTDKKSEVSFEGVLEAPGISGYDSSGIVRGVMGMRIIHESILKQEPSMKAYKGTTSNAIKEVLKGIYSDFDVDPSGGESIYYQSGKPSIRYATEDLKPKLYDIMSMDSPYYLWLDWEGKVHIRHRKSLMEQPIKATLILDRMHKQKDLFNYIFDIAQIPVSIQNGYRSFTDIRNTFDFGTGEVSATERSCLENYKKIGEKHLIMYDNVKYGIKSHIRTPQTPGEEEILKGIQINNQEPMVAPQKFTVVIGLNPLLRAGDVISILTRGIFLDEETSETYSGKWLIEQVSHSYNGISESQQAFTTLTISRGSFKVLQSNNYGLAKLLASYK